MDYLFNNLNLFYKDYITQYTKSSSSLFTQALLAVE